MADDLRDGFPADRAAIDAALSAMCDRELCEMPAPVREAIRYGLLGEGKRLRGLLVQGAYRAAGGRGDPAPLAAAVEVVHAYSLVHDDLPCMDDDDLRRGRPTVHRVFGDGTAMIAGVVMVPLAAVTAFHAATTTGVPVWRAGQIVRELMRASGAGGMVGGQWLDLQAEGRRIPLEELEQIHRAKTGLLIAASVRIGATAAGADEVKLAAFTRYGDALGLAFQIADDVLDVTATSAQLGKTAGRDVALGKVTYPLLLGVDGALARAHRLAEEACEALRARGCLTPDLERLAVHIVERKS